MTFLILNSNDNVFVALDDFKAGQRIGDIELREDIPKGHKLASRIIEIGDPVVKYGMPIGHATCKIRPGEHVHEQNMKTSLGQKEFPAWAKPSGAAPSTSSGQPFLGFSRDEGVAIRNEVWIVNTVACVNQTASRLAERANAQLAPKLENVDGFFAFPHPFGCSQLGDDLNDTQKILAGLINHRHAGAVLVLGLGCENNRMESQLAAVHPDKKSRIRFFNTQDVGDEMEEGFSALEELGDLANQSVRSEIDASQLVLGMKCGGSDGLSGITANPLLGRISDRHCRAGGTVLLTEVPEMFGAEPVLLKRCATAEVHSDFCEMINEFKDYFRSHDQPISENPSPGNREGGITTLEEKSLGCVQKGGTSALVKQIVPYGSPVQPGLGGLALINGPGNDGVSITALTCSGANVVLFTTGRGTPMGAPVPTLKISTNNELTQRKPSWIDFNAGRLLKGSQNLDQLADELYELILQTASGNYQAKNEANGYREIAIWKTGVTL